MKKTKEMMDATHKRHKKALVDQTALEGDEDDEPLLRCGCGEFGEANYFADDEPRFVCGGRWCMP